MQQGLGSSDKVIVADFFSSGYRLSGSFDASTKSLADTLYDISTDYMMIRDTYLSPVTDPAQIMSHHPSTVLYKQNLDFVLALEESTGKRSDMRYRLPPHQHEIFIILPMFIIYGSLHIHQRQFDPRFFMSNDAGTFITLLKVMARCTYNPDVIYEGASALVSRSKISFLGQYNSHD